MRVLIVSLILSSLLSANFIIKRYPAYAYVLSEFDIDSSYVYDDEFYAFVKSNYKNLEKFYTKSLKRGDFFIPTIKRGLIDNSLSDLLVYVSIIESGLVSDIKSYKKAVGLWQFMPSTAKRYKLHIDKCYDERCDPYKSTQTAVKYLKYLYDKFGKWYLAVLAYNCGEGRLSRAIKKAKSDELSTLINDDFKYLPKESRDYIRKILLVALIGESKDNWFEIYYPDIVSVEVGAKTNLKDIAKMLDMSYKKLMRLNARYKSYILPDDRYTYKINIPEEKMITFYKKYQMPPKIIKKSFLISYHVKLGDTLESIAQKFNTTVEDIKIANHLDEEYLSVEQLLIIPTNKPAIKHI